MHVTALYIYPVKALAGISLPRALVEKRGLAFDRRWMLVDRDGLFISQREIPQLALFQPAFEGPNLIIRRRLEAAAPLTVPVWPPDGAEEMEVQIWDDHCSALRVSRQADQWFSRLLNRQCHLVYLPEESIRPVSPDYGQPGEITSFADSCPLLAIGEASLSGLNQRLETPVPMDRFRPNIVFAGGRPYEEEEWKSFHIGTARFRGIRPCGRCQVITIDQESAERSKEPLQTLSTYRRQGRKVVFGLHASWAPRNGGEAPHIQVGDEIVVDSRKT